MKVIRNTPHIFTHEEAARLAETLKRDDPTWDYRVIRDPQGGPMSIIKVYDEEGEYVETL